MSDRVTIIIPPDLKGDIDQLKASLHLDQSSLIRHLLYEAIREEKIKLALEKYKKGLITFHMAAAFAGITLWELIDEAHRRNVGLNFSLAEATEELEKIRSGAFDEFLPKKK